MNDDLDAIPQELREFPHWVLYRLQRRKGKITKEPYQTSHAARRASSTDPKTWGTYESALAARQRGAGDGIGFVFSPDDPYTGADFDDCVHDGTLDDRARPFVERLNSYTELSPSGTGLHTIGRGKVGKGRQTKETPWGGKFELYDRARFFTITGIAFDGMPVAIVDLVDLAAVRAELLPDPPATGSNGQTHSAEHVLDDRELLERAFNAKNGAKFQTLWNGDRGGYGSDSEADCALCAMLAFWAGPDPARIDRLFQSSGLMREKWDREDYRDATIEKALAGRTEFYEPRLSGVRAAEQIPADNPLLVASTLIGMTDIPLIAAEERRGGKVVLERRDGLQLAVSALGALGKYDRLSVELGAQFGHELVVEKGEGARTAVRFVAALRRHFGPSQVDALERRVKGWMVRLVLLAGETKFDYGDPESKLLAWKTVDAADPEIERGARGFAEKVVLAHDTSTGDRYLSAGWPHEYLRRCGWSAAPDVMAGTLEAIGLRQPNSDGRVTARRRADDELVTLRFWVIPDELYEAWTA